MKTVYVLVALALLVVVCAGDYANVKCDTAPIDVQNGPVSVTCTLDASISAGIYATNLYATISVGHINEVVAPRDAGQDNINQFTFFGTYVLNFPRYCPYGNYTVYGSAISYGGSFFTSGTTTITVLQTINDMGPPTLTALGPSVLNFNDDNNGMVFSATDDVMGVASARIYLMSGSSYVGYAMWTGGPQTSVTAFAPLTLYAGTGTGTYSLVVYLDDANDYDAYIPTSQLASMNFITSVTIDINNCTAGTYRAYNTTGACTTCGVGTYSKAGAFKCVSCPPGTYSANSTTCLPCPAGTSGIGASWACSPCAAGTYTASSGNPVCSPCSPGYNSSIGSQSCSSCPAGTYSHGGTATCSACAPGTYSAGGSFLCTQCVPGTYTSTYGASACQPCPQGSFSWVGFASCTACPSPTYNGPLGSNSRLNCY